MVNVEQKQPIATCILAMTHTNSQNKKLNWRPTKVTKLTMAGSDQWKHAKSHPNVPFQTNASGCYKNSQGGENGWWGFLFDHLLMSIILLQVEVFLLV